MYVYMYTYIIIFVCETYIEQITAEKTTLKVFTITMSTRTMTKWRQVSIYKKYYAR